MLLAELVATSTRVGATRNRREKVTALVELLVRLDGDEVAVAVAYLSGHPRQDRLELGVAAVRNAAAEAADEPTLTVAEVNSALQRIAEASGAGSRTARRGILGEVLTHATGDEQRFLRGLVLRELRQGALEGLMVQAIGRAAEVTEEEVRRALMVHADLGDVAAAALQGGTAALEAFRMRVFHPVLPMLASTAADVADAVAGLDEVVVEHKIDGARVQIHRDGEEVRVYTRNRNDITRRVPELVAVARALPVRQVVMDGEAIAMGPDGRPLPFQTTMARFGRENGDTGAGDGGGDGSDADGGTVRLSMFLFDVLHLDGENLIDRPMRERRAVLARVVPEEHRVPATVTASVDVVRDMLRGALDDGHEGVMVKSLDVPYEAGRRGSGWRKVKPVHTLDLVVLAAEWGSGRRRGWLSNLHLGARDPATGGFVMLGKTFKGLTDEVLGWQTEALLAREVRRTAHVVHVIPELVVEIAFDGVQTSPRYAGGLALRFARVKGYRPDKDPLDADTIDTVRAIHRGEVRATV
jgi:DNA ligase-1